ncbi:DUF4920 domain-containing protein [Mangrovivirga sp. M17]|uniref:DUF4920 domain-containing protein n=1 Tax=Mangrovivirga halotolerans TaxID=2993936 RepID=A0ABT3RTX6_9BACT|nr:DUF4920 domain-containing protein [Mangrovivirga halotolerans]MCX2745235.1 DUF4920 domain-containing protein [Mangrovivirga halotolerans]
MKKRLLFLIFLAVFTIISCNSNKEKNNADQVVSESVDFNQSEYSFYGEEITKSGYSELSSPEDLLNGKDSSTVKVTGEVSSVCKKKGCWMTLDIPGQLKPLRVTFKDYSFFVPKNIEGRKVIVKGVLKKEVQSEEMRKHYAADEEKSQEDIEKIKGNEIEYSLVADGVILM